MHVEGIISMCNTIMTFIAFSALRKLPSNPILFSKTAMENNTNYSLTCYQSPNRQFNM